MFKKIIPYLDLEQIAQSGQCFRMIRLDGSENRYRVISRDSCLLVSQQGDELCFDCPDRDLERWLTYFDCDTDYEKIQMSVNPEDTYLKTAASLGKGIRILKQDAWEMIVTFILSQQKTIPKIREAVETLSLLYGTPISYGGEVFHTFPSSNQLLAASLEDLKALKLGYRAKYIYRVCRDNAEGRLDLELLAAMDYREAMDYLTGFYGIGEKVANCVCLFGLHHIDAFPVDTWIQKILLKEYYQKEYDSLPKSKLYETMVRENFGRYEGCGGIMQQYIFHYERNILGGK